MAWKKPGRIQRLLVLLLLLCSCAPGPSPGSAPYAAQEAPSREEEAFSLQAQRVVEDLLSQDQTPHRLGLFDVNEDGTPEIMVQNYIGQASSCILYDLTDPEPAETSIRLNWPAIRVDAVYIQRVEAGVKWRIEGDDSHGFTNRTRNEIVEIENGEVKTIDCERTCILGDDKEPCSLSVRTVVNKEELESLDLPLEGVPADAREELLAGSLYQSYIRQDWEELDSPPWVLEETTAIGPDRLETRLQALYREWSSSR